MGLINRLSKPQTAQEIKSMYEKEEKIKELKHQRFYLRDKIHGRLKKGYKKEYVKNDVIKFNNIIKELLDLGVDTWIECDYLKLENYKDIVAMKKPRGNIKNQSQLKEMPSKTPSKTSLEKTPIKNITKDVLTVKPIEDNHYILNLAWTETSTNIPTKVVNVVKNYFEKMGIQEKFTESNKIGNSTEHIIQYNYIGNDHSFNLLKKSAHYLLNIFSKTDFEKFNIDVYGKKII